MLTILLLIEKNDGLPKEFLDKAKTVLSQKSADYMQIPSEDLYLILDKKIEEIKEI